ncbi:MAG: lipid-A-disaccharide synthase [Blastocatellia bacterium]
MIVAGEASGDRHGAALAQALRRLHPETAFEMFGAGGEEMRAAGVDTLVDAREFASIGIPEIARGLGKHYGAYRKLLSAARARQPAAVVLIDWPDFNMRLARALRRAGLHIVYYISPQVWAWRRYRVRALRRDVERMLVILPFEVDFYKGQGMSVDYVGHPLVKTVQRTATRKAFCKQHHLDESRPIIALLPGSRQKEIHYHVPVMLDAARRLRNLQIETLATPNEEVSLSQPNTGLQADALTRQSKIQNPQFVLPIASTISRNQIAGLLAQMPDAPPVTLIERDTYNALFHAAFAIVASGTATVETALAGTPMVIVYRASQLNWRLIRPLIHLDTFGMVNLIAGRRIVPELMQKDATGERIAAEVQRILTDPQRLARMHGDLEEVRQRLAEGGSAGAERAARAVMQVVGQPASGEAG